MDNLQIKGSNPIDLSKRKKALELVNKLSTKELTNLSSLANNTKARVYLSNDLKFQGLKRFL